MKLLFLLVLITSTAFNIYSFNTEANNLEVEGDLINLTLFHVNDLHGWLNPHDGIGGMATMYSHLVDHGYSNVSRYILTSGGDQNTGPAAATVSKGEAVIDVMNGMGFDVAAIGNHEFDFGIDQMEKRRNMSNFPIISANIFDVSTNNLANFTTPWVIQNHGGINVGIIGLTTTSTYTSSHPKITQYFDFGDYEEAIRDNYQDMIDSGAKIIIVLAHVPPDSLTNLANNVSDLNITVFLGGHGGNSVVKNVGDSMIAMAGHKGKQFAKIEIQFDNNSKVVTSVSGQLIDNIEGTTDPSQSIQTIIDKWDALLDLDRPLTYSSSDIYDTNEGGIGALVTDGFQYYMHHQGLYSSFGITNRGGGFRDYIRAGNISIADVISVIPFENNLMLINITGHEFIAMYKSTQGALAFSGIKYYKTTDSYETLVDWQWVKIETKNYYTGVITDYTWYKTYQHFSGTDTGFHYRDAVISYFETLEDLNKYTTHRFMYNQIISDTSTTTTGDISTTTTSETTNIDVSLTTSSYQRVPYDVFYIFVILLLVLRYNRKDD